MSPTCFNDRELVSIIMPVFNGEKYLKEAVESVFSQEYKNWQLIIVNDNSSDGTKGILDEIGFLSSKVIIIENKENIGVALSRNKAILEASGDWIAFIDADDVWHPSKLKEQIHLAKLTNSLVVLSPYYVIDEFGIVKGLVEAKSVIRARDMSYFNPIGNLTGMYRSSILGKFLQRRIKHEDYVMWMEIIRKAEKARSTPKPLAFYRKTNTSLSASKIKTIQWQWRIYRQEFRYSTPRSLFGLLVYAGHNLTKVKSVKQPIHYKSYIL